MPPPPPAPVAALLADPQRHLAGTDARLTLALSRTLINEILAARPPDTPVEELFIDPDAANFFNLHLRVKAPVIGSVRRKLTIQPGPPVSFPEQPWLQFNITDGFKLLDKPIIKVMQGTIADRLPRGVELTSSYLRLHVPALLTAAGYQQLVPLLEELRLSSSEDVLNLLIHLRAAPTT